MGDNNNNIVKTIYNSGKSYYDELVHNDLKLNYYQAKSNSLESIINNFTSYEFIHNDLKTNCYQTKISLLESSANYFVSNELICHDLKPNNYQPKYNSFEPYINDFTSQERLFINRDLYYRPNKLSWVDSALSLLSEKYSFKTCFENEFVPKYTSRICEISNELRLTRKEIRKKGYLKSLVEIIKELLHELHSLIKKNIHITKVNIKNLSKVFFSTLTIDFRKKFRTIVINLFNCFNDCSKSDEDNNSNGFNHGIILNHLTNNNYVPQKRYYKVSGYCNKQYFAKAFY